MKKKERLTDLSS